MPHTVLNNVAFTPDFSGVTTLQCMGDPSRTPATHPAGIPDSMEITPDGWFKATIRQSDPPTATGIRAETTLPADTLNTEYWYRWEMQVMPEDWTTDTGSIILGQMHPHDAIVGAVNFSVYCINRQLQFRTVQNPTSGSFAETTDYIGQLQTGKIYTFLVHTLWKTDTSGFIEAFVDGIQVCKRANIKTAYTGDAPYFKLGIYDAPHLANFGTKAARFRNLIRASGSDGYTALMNGVPTGPMTYINSTI